MQIPKRDQERSNQHRPCFQVRASAPAKVRFQQQRYRWKMNLHVLYPWRGMAFQLMKRAQVMLVAQGRAQTFPDWGRHLLLRHLMLGFVRQLLDAEHNYGDSKIDKSLSIAGYIHWNIVRRSGELKKMIRAGVANWKTAPRSSTCPTFTLHQTKLITRASCSLESMGGLSGK